MNSLDWLQQWYYRQCDDEWEHRHGITIQTLDNPGWLLKVDLAGTALEFKTMPEVGLAAEINHEGTGGKHDWINCKVENRVFFGAGGPFVLLKICEVFKNWVEMLDA
jgi:hypothetical protein